MKTKNLIIALSLLAASQLNALAQTPATQQTVTTHSKQATNRDHHSKAPVRKMNHQDSVRYEQRTRTDVKTNNGSHTGTVHHEKQDAVMVKDSVH